jgi:glycosyl transferase family 25
MRVNQLVGAVFVLSVRSFSDRIEHMRAEMARHDIEFEFVFEFDANAIPPAVVEETFGPSDLGRAQQSLVLKHLHVQRQCVERGLERVLVFEDDAVLDPDFAVAAITVTLAPKRAASNWWRAACCRQRRRSCSIAPPPNGGWTTSRLIR